jgi:hypothetical protein
MKWSRFTVDGGQDDVRSWVEIRCSVCGRHEEFGEDGDSASMDELTSWVENHQCPRGQVTNTTGRSTDRVTNGQPMTRNNVLLQADHLMTTQLFARSMFSWDMTPLDTYVDNLVDEFRSKKP